MNRAIFISTVCLLSVLLSSFSAQYRCQADSRSPDTSSDQPSLEMTVRRYFAEMAGYEEGDLIASSQVAELQQYLRKTRGHSPASHARMLHRVLPDASRLTRLFYAKRGASVLRDAAEKLQGYAALDRLSRTNAGYALLIKAIGTDSADQLVELLAVKSDVRPIAAASGNRQENIPRPTSHIYTVDEFLAAALAPSDGAPSATRQPHSER